VFYFFTFNQNTPTSQSKARPCYRRKRKGNEYEWGYFKCFSLSSITKL